MYAEKTVRVGWAWFMLSNNYLAPDAVATSYASHKIVPTLNWSSANAQGEGTTFRYPKEYSGSFLDKRTYVTSSAAY